VTSLTLFPGNSYIEVLGPRELPLSNDKAAGDAEVELPELGSSAVACLRLAVGTRAGHEVAHLARAIVTVRAENIGRRIAHVGLGEARHKTVGSLVIVLDRLLKEVGGHSLIVAGNMRVVAQQRGWVDREPSQHADVLAVGGSLEAQQSQGLVNIILVLDPLRLGVGQIRVGAPVDVGVGYVGSAKVEVALGQSASQTYIPKRPWDPTS
jgi:hypothetical protein